MPLFRRSSLLAAAFLVASIIPSSSARWFGGHNNDQNTGTTAEPSGRWYTPSGEFLITHNSDDWWFFPDRDTEMTFLRGDADQEAGCTAGVCKGHYPAVSVVGKEIDGGFKFRFAMEESQQVAVICPFGDMTPYVSDAWCYDHPQTSVLGEALLRFSGPVIGAFNNGEGCEDIDGIDTAGFVVDVICVPNEGADWPAMQAAHQAAARKANSFASEKRRATRANIAITIQDSDDDEAIWVDGIDTRLELIQPANDDYSYCTTTMCFGGYYSVYVRSPDPNKAIVYTNWEWDNDMAIICPYGDQLAHYRIVECEGDSDPEAEFTSFGPLLEPDDASCSADYFTVEIWCTDRNIEFSR